MSHIIWLISGAWFWCFHNYHRLFAGLTPVSSGMYLNLTFIWKDKLCDIFTIGWFYMTVLFPKRILIVDFKSIENPYLAIDGVNLFKETSYLAIWNFQMVEQVLSIMKSERCPPVVRVRPTKFRYLRFVQVSDTALSKALQTQNSSSIENNNIYMKEI